ncbi:MAG: CotH kinase family protein [Deltaproteobacteria bacterium]|nr:CotH kinase family protein [Deltaproteobacteria bacterium]MBN2673743.1 CotH kinase family protein [Deltaproteobacteria bacterium]
MSAQFSTYFLSAFLVLVPSFFSACHSDYLDDDDTDNRNTDTNDTGDSDSDTLTDTASDTGTPDTATDSTDIEAPACLSVVNPALADADAQALFDYDHVPVFDIFLPEEEWNMLIENAVDEEYTEASLCFEGQAVGTVGLRFKGSYGTLYGCFDDSGELICDRLSMKLKFDKYVEDQRLFGLKRLNFRANRHDDSRMKEKIVFDLFREMGITAPRAAWAVVRVNGESLGLYGMVEQIDGRMAADRFPDYPDGNVFKEIWPTDTVESTVVDGLRTNDEAPDVSAFLGFSQAIAAADDDEARLSVLGQYMDLDEWARYMAVDDAVVGYDGVTYFYTDPYSTHNHNYYIAEDTPGHFRLIPWDVEASFWVNPDHAAPHWTEIPDDCSLTYPYWSGYAIAPACDPIFAALNTNLGPWREAAQELLDGPFSVETMRTRIEQHAAFIGEAARAPETPTMYTTFDNSVSGLIDMIPELRERLQLLIADEE